MLFGTLRWSFLLFIASVLSACGGGGDESGSGTSASSSTTNATLSLSATTVSKSGITSDASAPQIAAIQASVNNPPANGLYYLINWTGTAVSAASMSWSSASTAQININLWKPGQLGAGTYTDTVTVTVCIDSACNQKIGNSPLNIAVNYTVTGSTLPTTTFNLAVTQWGFTANTVDAAPKASYPISIENFPAAGLYVRWNSTPNIVASIVFQQTNLISTVSGLGHFNVTMVDPAQLGPGIFTGSATFNVCFDAACVLPVPGGPITVNFTYTITASPNRDYTLKSVPIAGAADVAWDVHRGKLYAISTNGNLYRLEPEQGVIETTTTIGGAPVQLVISDDGAYGYVGFSDLAFVQRIRLSDMALDLRIPLGTDGSGNEYAFGQMAVAPQQSQTLAIARESWLAGASGGVAIFDSATQRSTALTVTNPYEEIASIAWGSTSSTLYALRTSYPPFAKQLDIFSVTANGLSAPQVIDNPSLTPNYSYMGNLLYGSDGGVIQASTGTDVGRYALSYGGSSGAVPDAQLDRVFFLSYDGLNASRMLEAFKLSDRTHLSLAKLNSPGPNGGYNSHLIRWGTNGLAFNTGQSVELISGVLVAP